MSISEQLLWFENLKDSPSYMAESNKINFAVEIEKAISANKISQTQLAEIIGVSPAYISKILRGDANLTIETMTKFAYSLGKCLHLYLANKDATVKWVVESFSSATPNVTYISAIEQISEKPRSNAWLFSENSNENWSTLIFQDDMKALNNVN